MRFGDGGDAMLFGQPNQANRADSMTLCAYGDRNRAWNAAVIHRTPPIAVLSDGETLRAYLAQLCWQRQGGGAVFAGGVDGQTGGIFCLLRGLQCRQKSAAQCRAERRGPVANAIGEDTVD